ncbi:hypothetical protein [Actinocatenispora rupis]|nr:hypothetical protein [Actinocatenispora rupis]
MTQLTIPARFCGPADSANGGYLAGRLARLAPGPHGTVVTLHARPPLERALDVDVEQTDEDTAAALYDGERLIASARSADPFDALVPPVGFEVAELASAGYPGFTSHPFPGCFVCGHEREKGDGLRLFPGRLDDGTGRTACPWVPDESATDASGHVPPEIVWAALDCPGGWTADMEREARVLGRIAGRVRDVPKPGEHCVIMGRSLGSDGRKTYVATTIYGPDGAILGQALATWLTLRD